jgi:hypothetical protein
MTPHARLIRSAFVTDRMWKLINEKGLGLRLVLEIF